MTDAGKNALPAQTPPFAWKQETGNNGIHAKGACQYQAIVEDMELVDDVLCNGALYQETVFTVCLDSLLG